MISREAIARDVLAQLDRGALRAEHMYGLIEISGRKRLQVRDQLKPFLMSGGNRGCGACAMGALFISYVRKYNKVKLGDINFDKYCYNKNEDRYYVTVSDYQIVRELGVVFTDSELREIERAYEGYREYANLGPKSSAARLRKICNEIIKFGGFTGETFKPKKGYEDLPNGSS